MNKVSKILPFTIVVLTIFMATNIVFGEGVSKTIKVVFNAVKLQVNGKYTNADNLVYNNTTYVPLRKVAEMLDMSVEWNRKTNSVSISNKEKHTSSNEYVPNAETAIKIAEAVLLPIYGEEIYKERPFTAEQSGDTWIIKGSLPKGYAGGVAEVEISMSDGEILKVTHSK